MIAMDSCCFIHPDNPLADLAGRYLQAMLAMERQKAFESVVTALDDGVRIDEIYLRVVEPVQLEVGRLWQTGKISVGHEHYCTNATQRILSALYPRWLKAPVKDAKVVLLTCVEGELHELGLRMLADFFEMDGWDAHFLGAGTPSESILGALREKRAHLLCVGATMHDGAKKAKQLIDSVRQRDDLKTIPVLVGGYTFRTVGDLWQKVGANGTAPDARRAVALSNQLTEVSGETNA